MGDRHRVNRRGINVWEVLVRVVSLPIETWNYLSTGPSIRHIGPMASDFRTAFGFGEDDSHINMFDGNGVALAAIQGLNQILEEQEIQITVLWARLGQLVPRLEKKLDALEQRKNGQQGH